MPIPEDYLPLEAKVRGESNPYRALQRPLFCQVGANNPSEAISLDGDTAGTGNGENYLPTTATRGELNRSKRQRTTFYGPPEWLKPSNPLLLFFLQRTKSRLSSTGGLARNRHSELFATLASTVAEDLSAAWRGHAFQEPMNTLALFPTRLIRPFHKAALMA